MTKHDRIVLWGMFGIMVGEGLAKLLLILFAIVRSL
jgi:hypothetical protein